MVAWELGVILNLIKSVSFILFLWAVLWFHYYVCHPSIIMDSTFFHSQGCPRFDDKLIVTLILPLCPMKSISKWPIHWKPNCLGQFLFFFNFFFLNLYIYFNWRLITLQYCSGFCHTLTWISHGCTCVSHPEPPPPTSLPIPSLSVVPEHQLWVPYFMHRTWTGDLFHIW